MPTKCRSKVFPCPAGERCPEHRDAIRALDYSIQQQDFNLFAAAKNKLLPTRSTELTLNVSGTNVFELGDRYKKVYEVFQATLSKAERSAVRFYTEGELYRVVNGWLRHDSVRRGAPWPTLEAEVLAGLDAVTTKQYTRPNPQAPLWRAISGEKIRHFLKTPVGGTITDAGFTSTSYNPGSLQPFLDTKNPVILQIYTTKGVPVSRRYEFEYLLPRNMRFKVESKRVIDMNFDKEPWNSHERATLIVLREIV